MQIESNTRRRRPAVLAALTVSVLAVGGVLTGCGGDEQDSSERSLSFSQPQQQAKTAKKVLWMGDSIAGVEAPPLNAALTASGVKFKNAASDGGGTIVEGDRMAGMIAKRSWKRLKADIASFKPNVIAYQITTYDWGTAQQQRASYGKLAKSAQAAGAELVIVSAPPFKLDDFYKPHARAFKTAPRAAKQVADSSGGGKVRFLDASALWGSDSAAAKAQRSADGIHSCQQGSASFAKWFTEQLGKVYGFTPAAPQKWAGGSWADDTRYAKLGCS